MCSKVLFANILNCHLSLMLWTLNLLSGLHCMQKKNADSYISITYILCQFGLNIQYSWCETEYFYCTWNVFKLMITGVCSGGIYQANKLQWMPCGKLHCVWVWVVFKVRDWFWYKYNYNQLSFYVLVIKTKIAASPK